MSVSIGNSSSSSSIMKTFQLTDDQVVVMKKHQGQLSVMIKQKDSTDKFIEFYPSR